MIEKMHRSYYLANIFNVIVIGSSTTPYSGPYIMTMFNCAKN